jgi:hypothetical protein
MRAMEKVGPRCRMHAKGGHLESVQVLLAKKRLAGANITDKNRLTPLSYAAAEGRVDVVAALLGKGRVG